MNRNRNISRATLALALAAVTAWLVVQNAVLIAAFALRSHPEWAAVLGALGKVVWIVGSVGWPLVAGAFGLGLVYGAMAGVKVRRVPGRVVSRV